MKMHTKPLAAAALFVALAAATGSQSVTVQPSSIGFKDALAACPAGTLGAISLTLGHVRVAEAAGVDSDIDDAAPNDQTVSLTSGGKSAMATVNAAKKTVAAKHVTLASQKRVACVAPD
jgi:hypothetical protein